MEIFAHFLPYEAKICLQYGAALTFTERRYKTFFLYVVGENSHLLYKRIAYIMYAVGKNSPMTWT